MNGDLMKNYNVDLVAQIELCDFLSTLLSAGVPKESVIQSAMKINPAYAPSLNHAYQQVKDGKSFAEALLNFGQLHPVIGHLAMVGEASDSLPFMLNDAARLLERHLKLNQISNGNQQQKEEALFYFHLAAFLDAGQPTMSSLRIMAEYIGFPPENPGVLTDIAARMFANSSLSEAMAAWPKFFPESAVLTIQAGENSGTLESTTKLYAQLLERRMTYGNS